MASRTEQVIRNIIWGMLEKIVLLLLPFATRTILIKVLGAQYLGLGSLFGSILSVLSLSELGFGSAVVFSMYKPVAKGDTDTICALLNTFRKVYRIVGIIIVTAGLLIMPFIGRLIKGNPPENINIYILYAIYLLNTGISYFMFAYKAALFSAHQRNDLTSKRGMTINIISNVLQFALLLLFKNYYAYIIVLPIATIATNLTNAYLAKKLYPQYVCRGSISKHMLSDIKKRVAGLLSFKIYGVIFSSVDVIVISSFLGLVPLAIYNNYFYIQTTIIGFLNVFTVSITASVGNKMVTNSTEDNYNDLNKFSFMNAWLSCWCAICLLCLYQPFIKLWIGDDYLFPIDTMILMVFYFLLPRISCLTYTYREAAGLWWEDRFRPIIAAIANLLINLSLVNIIGMNGIIFSTIFCSVFINIPWGTYILFKNYFKRSMWGYLSKIIFYLLTTCVVGAITYCICNLINYNNIVSLIIKGIICIIVPNILFILFYHRVKEFDYAKTFVINILNKYKRKFER